MKKDQKRRLKDELKLDALLLAIFGLLTALLYGLYLFLGGTGEGAIVVVVLTVIFMLICRGLIGNPGLLSDEDQDRFFKQKRGKRYAGITVVPRWVEPALQKVFKAPIGGVSRTVGTYVDSGDGWAYIQPVVGHFPRAVLEGKYVPSYFVPATNLYTVFMIKLPYDYPKIIFDYKHNKGRRASNYKNILKSDDVILCEGVFTKDYDMFSEQNKKIEALAIASPELLEKVQNYSEGADVFVVDNFLYFIYDRELIQSPLELEAIFFGGDEVKKELIDNFPRTRRV